MLTILIAAAMSVAEPKCPLPGEWDLDPATSDEFDGAALDKAKWWDFLPHVVGRMTYFNHGRNVRVKDGCLELWTVRETDQGKMPYGWLEEGRSPFSTAVVKSRKKVYGGYFECRMKMNTAPVRSAFWLYDPLSDALHRKYAPDTRQLGCMRIVLTKSSSTEMHSPHASTFENPTGTSAP